MKACNCGGTCREAKSVNKSGFYLGVMDVEVKSGTINDMQVVDQFRIFNDKFVDSPELALLIAFDEKNERWKTDPKNILKDVTFDPVETEWKRTILETTNGHTPSEKQRKKWERGEYVLNLITEYVQIVETNLVGNDKFVQKAITDWREKKSNFKV